MGNLEIIGYSRYLKTPVSLKLRRDMTNYMWKVEHSKNVWGGGVHNFIATTQNWFWSRVWCLKGIVLFLVLHCVAEEHTFRCHCFCSVTPDFWTSKFWTSKFWNLQKRGPVACSTRVRNLEVTLYCIRISYELNRHFLKKVDDFSKYQSVEDGGILSVYEIYLA